MLLIEQESAPEPVLALVPDMAARSQKSRSRCTESVPEAVLDSLSQNGYGPTKQKQTACDRRDPTPDTDPRTYEPTDPNISADTRGSGTTTLGTEVL